MRELFSISRTHCNVEFLKTERNKLIRRHKTKQCVLDKISVHNLHVKSTCSASVIISLSSSLARSHTQTKRDGFEMNRFLWVLTRCHLFCLCKDRQLFSLINSALSASGIWFYFLQFNAIISNTIMYM